MVCLGALSLLALGACRQLLGVDEDALLEDRSVPAGNEQSPDPAWARWPVPSDVQPGFELAGGSMKDKRSGLIWQRGSGGRADWETARKACEDLDLGVGVFRLPTRIELASVLDYDPALPSYFSETFLPAKEPRCFWTMSEEPDRISHWAFVEEGVDKMVMLTGDDQKCATRCVVGGPYDYAKNVPPVYVIEQGVFRDPGTRLEWQARDAESKGRLVSLESARAECRALRLLDHEDWRLPSIKELLTLVDERRSFPATDRRVYSENDVYWTSTLQKTADAGAPPLAWRVSFSDGTPQPSDDPGFQPGIGLVRCVRDY